MFQDEVIVPNPGWGFRLMAMLTMTTGTAFIMWLGEQIDRFGIGNGISILITAGIVESIPEALRQTYVLFKTGQLAWWALVVMAALFFFTIVGVIYIIQGTRKIPVQHAKQIRGSRVYGGNSTYIPLKVNQAGVIPIIFAQSVILFSGDFGWIFSASRGFNFCGTFFELWKSWVFFNLWRAHFVFYIFLYSDYI